MAPPTCEESWCHKCASTIPMAPGLHILIDSRARVHQYYPAALIPAPFHVDDHQGTGVLEHKREFAQCCSDEGIKWGQVLYASSPGRSIPRPVFIGISVALFLCVGGCNPCIATAITLIGNNYGPVYTHATAMGFFFSVANCAANMSSNVYPSSAPPHFFRGHGIALTFSFLAIVGVSILKVSNSHENARRQSIRGCCT
ncbi:hypothetical protein BS47DRAFT_1490600 [Hydnum rufescens UP504]|uniref:Uncharacterized protein n=1 Tax=Hydnum rufescens UP504 TaxID=1448309 RepID=A0A9P6DFE8_9AGAM|nr:hypothetical protein BS47DRAFT_1490600 [Hydnum rufescens UP504]